MFYFSSKANVKEIFTPFGYSVSVMTITRSKFILVFGCLFVLAVLTGCEKKKSDIEAFQHYHCSAATSWMAKGEGTVEVIETTDSVKDNERTVVVHYDFIPHDPARYQNSKRLKLKFTCRYPVQSGDTREARQSAGRATYMKQGMRELSEEQIRRLNILIGLMGASGAPVKK